MSGISSTIIARITTSHASPSATKVRALRNPATSGFPAEDTPLLRNTGSSIAASVPTIISGSITTVRARPTTRPTTKGMTPCSRYLSKRDNSNGGNVSARSSWRPQKPDINQPRSTRGPTTGIERTALRKEDSSSTSGF
jgi:hypothetical protein